MDHSARPICAISTVTTERAVPEHASSRARRIQTVSPAKLYILPSPHRRQGSTCGTWPWCLVDMCERENLIIMVAKACTLAGSRMISTCVVWFRESLSAGRAKA